MVEGYGEAAGAAQNLVVRSWLDLRLPPVGSWAPPLRMGFHTLQNAKRIFDLTRVRSADFLLLLRDQEDGCPARLGPLAATWARDENLPFPVAVVLAWREFETWFLPCADLLVGPIGGRPGLRVGTRPPAAPENIRGAKEWLSRHMAGPAAYKPTLDQLPFTRKIDLARLRAANLASFGTFERALQFLGQNLGKAGMAYP